MAQSKRRLVASVATLSDQEAQLRATSTLCLIIFNTATTEVQLSKTNNSCSYSVLRQLPRMYAFGMEPSNIGCHTVDIDPTLFSRVNLSLVGRVASAASRSGGSSSGPYRLLHLCIYTPDAWNVEVHIFYNCTQHTDRPSSSVGNLEDFRRLGRRFESGKSHDPGVMFTPCPTVGSDYVVSRQRSTSRPTKDRD